jgi:hypothetical protein
LKKSEDILGLVSIETISDEGGSISDCLQFQLKIEVKKRDIMALQVLSDKNRWKKRLEKKVNTRQLVKRKVA